LIIEADFAHLFTANTIGERQYENTHSNAPFIIRMNKTELIKTSYRSILSKIAVHRIHREILLCDKIIL